MERPDLRQVDERAYRSGGAMSAVNRPGSSVTPGSSASCTAIRLLHELDQHRDDRNLERVVDLPAEIRPPYLDRRYHPVHRRIDVTVQRPAKAPSADEQGSVRPAAVTGIAGCRPSGR